MNSYDDNTKVTLTVGQLKDLVEEAGPVKISGNARVKITNIIRATDKKTGKFRINYEGETSSGQKVRWEGDFDGHPWSVLQRGVWETVFASEAMDDEDIAEFERTTTPGWDLTRKDDELPDEIVIGNRRSEDEVKVYSRKELKAEQEKLKKALEDGFMPPDPESDEEPKKLRKADVRRIENRLFKIQQLLGR